MNAVYHICLFVPFMNQKLDFSHVILEYLILIVGRSRYETSCANVLGSTRPT